MFIECSEEALKQAQSDSVKQLVGEKDEILFIFDSMLVDYALIKHEIHSEEFKATIARHGLSEDKVIKPKIQALVNELHNLNE